MSGVKECNKCHEIKGLTEFNPSDIKNRRYTCKVCKRRQRAEWKANRKANLDYEKMHTCTKCGFSKNAKQYYDSYLASSTYICKPCADVMTNQ